jgi:AcrR family transcriptional regulator
MRDRVLQAAVATLSTDGIAGFTTRRVARDAQTSTPAVYELFGDRAGLVREVFFAGFRELGRDLKRLVESDDPRSDLVDLITAYRAFVQANPALSQVMFARPFSDFDPGPDERAAGTEVRELVVRRVRRAIGAGILVGKDVDIAHVLLALAQGLAGQESAGWLGSTAASRQRRWDAGVNAVLDGLAPGRAPIQDLNSLSVPARRRTHSDRPSRR